MKILLFGKHFDRQYDKLFVDCLSFLRSKGVELSIFRPFADELSVLLPRDEKMQRVDFQSDFDVDLIISFGGDGTLLDTVPLIGARRIPVIGINTGHLGFLSHVAATEVRLALSDLVAGKYRVEERSMLCLEQPKDLFSGLNYGLNEVAIQRRDTGSLITAEVSVDGTPLATYRGDGLIIATATGSTAYSMSAGGPILTPDARNFVITPLAAHNLYLRPIVISDESVITVRVESRQRSCAISLDSRIASIDTPTEIKIRKNPFNFYLAADMNTHFFDSIRKKLLWGCSAI